MVTSEPFSVEDPTVKTLGFADHPASVLAAQCHAHGANVASRHVNKRARLYSNEMSCTKTWWTRGPQFAEPCFRDFIHDVRTMERELVHMGSSSWGPRDVLCLGRITDTVRKCGLMVASLNILVKGFHQLLTLHRATSVSPLNRSLSPSQESVTQ